MKKKLLAVAALAALSAPALAVDILLPNGSFEAGSGTNVFGATATSWTLTFLQDDPTNNILNSNSLGAFGTFGSLAAPSGSRMLVLNNLGAGTAVLTSPVISLTNQFYINGIYSYLTNDPAGIVQRDNVDLVINYFADAGGTVQLLPSQTFSISANMPPIGTVVGSSGPFGVSSFRTTTGFHQFSIFINQFISQFATFSFVVRDDGLEDGGINTGVSGILLDNIFINPEPGTMALFGLGALGLGGIAWRRRKLRIASETTTVA